VVWYTLVIKEGKEEVPARVIQDFVWVEPSLLKNREKQEKQKKTR